MVIPFAFITDHQVDLECNQLHANGWAELQMSVKVASPSVIC